jgi:hypothetical protein
LRSLQFLGLNFNGVTGTLKSATRSGRSIEFDKEGLVLDLELRDLLSSMPSRQVPGISEQQLSRYVLTNGVGEGYEFSTVKEARKLRSDFEALGGGSSS